ncbi:MAG TPA: hypothetical protein VM846_01935 [Vicinamibacterales bacterium]|nr:hypothetical protein [Vicinamibacterales bacterium]
MNRTKSLIIAGLVLGSFVIAANGRAANIGRTEYLTLKSAAALPGVVLPPGTYTFERIEGHPDLVRVSNRLTNNVLYTGFTEVVRRQNRSGGPLTFGEAPRGEPMPIKAWFPDGSLIGNEFRHR